VAVEAVAMALGEVEVVAMRDLIHGKSGKKGAVLMGRPRSAASWEEDTALMLIERGEIHFESNPRGVGTAPKPTVVVSASSLVMAVGVLGLSTTAPSLVHLVEEKVFTHFSDEEKESKR
jgi:hypothetical protein